MKHPAVKITPAGRRGRPSVAALIVSRRRRNKYRGSNYRPGSTSAARSANAAARSGGVINKLHRIKRGSII